VITKVFFGFLRLEAEIDAFRAGRRFLDGFGRCRRLCDAAAAAFAFGSDADGLSDAGGGSAGDGTSTDACGSGGFGCSTTGAALALLGDAVSTLELELAADPVAV